MLIMRSQYYGHNHVRRTATGAIELLHGITIIHDHNDGPVVINANRSQRAKKA